MGVYRNGIGCLIGHLPGFLRKSDLYTYVTRTL
jgi:hypothetical protein